VIETMALADRLRRPAFRWGLLLGAALAVVLVAVLSLHRGQGVTVLVADLSAQSDPTAAIATIAATAKQDDAGLVFLVPSDQVSATQVLSAIRRESGTALVVSLAPGEDRLQAASRIPSARILDLRPEQRFVEFDSTSTGRGWLYTTIWTLALLAAGCVLGPVLLRAGGIGRGPGAKTPSAAPTPAPARSPATTPRTARPRPVASTTSTSSPPARTPVDDWNWSADPTPMPGRSDLSRFTGRPAVTEPVRQCPQCASFDVRPARPDARAGAAPSTEQSFACAQCESVWVVGPQQAWPIVVVRPRRGSRP
jgi:hypothetical protein